MKISVWFLIILGVFLLSLVVPITLDEAYYQMWSREWRLGYLDHPPFIAWLNGLSTQIGLPLGIANGLVSGVCGLLYSLLYLDAAKRLYNDEEAHFHVACWIGLTSLAFLGVTLIATPDAPLAVFWMAFVRELCLSAKNKEPKDFFRLGVIAALGFLSKFTMVLCGPVLIIGWFTTAWRQYSTRQIVPFFLGLLFVLSPYLMWNAKHDWVSFKFQMGRGLSHSYTIAGHTPDYFPKVRSPVESDAEFQYFENIASGIEPEKPRKPFPAWVRNIQKPIEFLLGQVGLLGLISFLVLWAFAKRLFRYFRSHDDQVEGEGIDDRVSDSLKWLKLSFLVPWFFFGVLSIFIKTEANWAAMSLVGFGLWLPRYLTTLQTHVKVAAVGNLVIITLLGFHAVSPILPIDVRKDRLRKETIGFKEIASFLNDVDGSFYFDRYQDGSMLKHYRPELQLRQWPGDARVSEFLRSPELLMTQPITPIGSKSFWWIRHHIAPMVVEGFRLKQHFVLQMCENGQFIGDEILPSSSWRDPCAGRFLRRLMLSRYELE